MTIPSDPLILLSYINTKLRDEYSSLDLLCEDLGTSRDDLTKKLADLIHDTNAFSKSCVPGGAVTMMSSRYKDNVISILEKSRLGYYSARAVDKRSLLASLYSSRFFCKFLYPKGVCVPK